MGWNRTLDTRKSYTTGRGLCNWETPTEAGGFASNGFGERAPGGYGMGAAFLTELVMTLFFLIIILGATAKADPAGFAPIAIGLCLTLIHLISIPVTNTSVNPARSTGVAFFADAGAVGQMWLFWLAPIAGALVAGFIARWLQEPDRRELTMPGPDSGPGSVPADGFFSASLSRRAH